MMHTKPENPFRTFWDLGYRNLLPVIPPGASTFGGKPLPDAGKVPGVYRSDKEAWRPVGYDKFNAQESDLAAWHEWGASVGMCGDEHLFFVDIDHMDETAAQHLRDMAEAHLGPSFARVGQAPKLALPYRSTELVKSRKIKFAAELVGGKTPGLDIISTNPYMVVAGTHAATGLPYDWPDGIPHYDQLPRVTPEKVADFLRAVEAEFPFGTVSVERAREDRGAAPDPEILRGDPKVLDDALRHLPNPAQRYDRDGYLKIGYAIKAGYGPALEDYAEELFQRWCGRLDEGEQDWDKVAKDWRGMVPPYYTGAEHIYNEAEILTDWQRPAAMQIERAKEFFEPQDLEVDETAQTHEGYHILSVGEVMRMEPPTFLIDRHIPQNGFGILYGDPGCGKSFIALDMALSLAYGLSAWHGDTINAKSRKVLYIAGEGASGFQSRIAAWQAMHKDEIAGRACEAGFLFQSVNFMRPEDIKRVVQAVRQIGQEWAMVVVDTVSRAIPGADENMQKDMTIFVHACDAIRAATGAFVLGVHHTAKAGTMRGSSVFLGQADVVLRLTRQKGASVGRLECEKQKDAPDGWGDAYRLSVVEAGEGRQSLVPMRLADGTPGGGSVDVGLQNMMLRAADTAWKSGQPWSENARAGDRYAPRILSKDFGLGAEQAASLLDIWLGQRIIVSDVADKKSKKKGLRVAAFISENTDETSETDDIFG